MKLGKLDLGRKLFLAPMADVSDAPFRKIAKEFGAGITFTQMVSAKGIIDNEFDALRLFAFSRDEKPIGVQLLANNPDYVSQAVTEIVRNKPDLIDINCGCPVDKVTKHKLGAELMDDPLLLGKLVSAMANAGGEVPISVKLRLGKNKSQINIIENARIAEENGASVIILHARSRSTKYKEDSDWEWIKNVKDSVSIPVVGNGSLFEPEDILKMINDTGCDSVMVARGALGNPFIFRRYNEMVQTGSDPGEPSFDEIADAVIQHCKLLAIEYQESIAAIKARKNIIWYYKYYDGIDLLIDRIMSSKSIENEIEIINDHTEKLKAGNYPPSDREMIRQKFNDRVLFWLDN